ncbi:hypothetical protein ABH905_003885 [Pseudomonas frederiksbergensis]|jgi:hypothetical protein
MYWPASKHSLSNRECRNECLPQTYRLSAHQNAVLAKFENLTGQPPFALKDLN